MRILTVRQPFAWAIIHGGKDVENRTRNIAGSYRGPVAIHAGLERDDAGWSKGRPGSSLVLLDGVADRIAGAIIGVIDLADVHRGISEDGGEICWCSPWAQVENWHLTLTNPRPLTKPLTQWADGTPVRGALGLRTLTAEQERWILDHMEADHG